MSISRLTSGLLLLALSASGSAFAQTTPPPPLPLKTVDFPEYEQVTLKNGAQVLIVRNAEQPVVTVNLRIRSGTAYDPAGKEGLAGLTADMLNKGTKRRSALEIAEAVDFIGASVGAGAGVDWTSATATTLTAFLDEALGILADIVINPTFPADELEIERKRLLTALQLELSQPEQIAGRHFIGGLYGEHPYGNLMTTSSLESIKQADLVNFHRKYYRPNNALFVVAGDVETDDFVKRLEKHFRGWKGGSIDKVTVVAPPARSERQVHLYHKPGSVQAVLRIGHLMEPATHPDWVALDVGMRVLGGGSTAWLFQVLRQEKGYTYGAYAQTAKRIERGFFEASAEVRNEVTDSSLSEMLALISRIRTEPVPAEDLELAKDYITGSFPRQIETPQQVAGQIATTRLLGLSDDYLETYRDRVAAVSTAKVQEAAGRHLQPDRALIVVVGDATQIYDKVAPFGSVALFDTEGNPISLADLEVKAATIAFDATAIEPATLVYSLIFQENPIGELTTEVKPESVDGRKVVRSHTAGGAMAMTMEHEVVFDAATFAGIKSHVSQKMGPQGIEIDLQLENGKLTGSVQGPSGEPTAVDAEVVEGTLLPGMDDYVIWLADFSKTKTLEIPSFSPMSGNAYTLMIKVVGETTVTVGAGEFEAYELEVSGAEGTTKLFARKAAPHIILRQEPAGQPLVIELKEMR